MAWTLVTPVVTASSGTAPFTSGSATTTGADVIVVGISGNANGAPTVTDNKGNTYTPAQTQTGSGGSQAWIFYCHNPVVGAGHTWTTNVAGATMNIAAFASGLAGTLYVDTTSSHFAASGTSIQAGSVTPQQTGELIVTEFLYGTTQTTTIDSGFATPVGHITSSGVFWGGWFSWLSDAANTAINPKWANYNSGAIAINVVFQISAGPTLAKASGLAQEVLLTRNAPVRIGGLAQEVLRTVTTVPTKNIVSGVAEEVLLARNAHIRIGGLAIEILRTSSVFVPKRGRPWFQVFN